MLIQSGLGSPPVALGGFFSELPKDLVGLDTKKGQVAMAWTYQRITSEPTYCLDGQDGFTSLIYRIKCHGVDAPSAIRLADLIDRVLRGAYSGVLPDADQTVVQGIFRQPDIPDGFSETNQSFVSTLEYLVNYQQD